MSWNPFTGEGFNALGIRNFLRVISQLGIIAIGAGMLIIAGEFDLSYRLDDWFCRCLYGDDFEMGFFIYYSLFSLLKADFTLISILYFTYRTSRQS
jgi:ribose/xylose/arabinose/galactoside ABC-type transport system permease subunit